MLCNTNQNLKVQVVKERSPEHTKTAPKKHCKESTILSQFNRKFTIEKRIKWLRILPTEWRQTSYWAVLTPEHVNHNQTGSYRNSSHRPLETSFSSAGLESKNGSTLLCTSYVIPCQLFTESEPCPQASSRALKTLPTPTDNFAQTATSYTRLHKLPIMTTIKSSHGDPWPQFPNSLN